MAFLISISLAAFVAVFIPSGWLMWMLLGVALADSVSGPVYFKLVSSFDGCMAARFAAEQLHHAVQFGCFLVI